MNTIIHDLTLDFSENRSLKVVKLKQNDNALTHIRLTLTHNGSLIQLDANEEEAYVSVSVGGVAVVVNDGCSIVGNKIEFDVTEQMTTLAGEGIADVKVSKNGFNIYTATFRLLIEPSAVNTDTPEILATTDFAKNFAEQTQLDWTAYIISAFNAMYPDYTETIITENLTDESTSYFDDPPFDILSTTQFDSTADGLFIVKNGKLISRNAYSFDLSHLSSAMTWIIYDDTKVSFSVGDVVTLRIYKKPASSGTAAPVSSHFVSSALPTNLSMVVAQEFISEGE